MAESTSGRPLAVSVELVPAPEQQAAPPVAARGWIVDPLRALPGPAPSSVDVRIEGRRFEIPDDAHTAGSSWLRDFVEACYLFGDWPRLHAVSWQLHWMAPALADEFACADALMASPPSGEILRHAYGLNDAYKQFPYGTRTDFPGWAPMLVRYLRTSAAAQLHLTPSPDRRAAAIAHVQSLTNAFDAALAAFRARLRGELGRVEACAKARALQQLGDARTTILNQGWRLLGYKDGRTFEDWAERDTAYLISAQFNPPDDLDA